MSITALYSRLNVPVKLLFAIKLCSARGGELRSCGGVSGLLLDIVEMEAFEKAKAKAIRPIASK
jgi:hypothetical protein